MAGSRSQRNAATTNNRHADNGSDDDDTMEDTYEDSDADDSGSPHRSNSANTRRKATGAAAKPRSKRANHKPSATANNQSVSEKYSELPDTTLGEAATANIDTSTFNIDTVVDLSTIVIPEPIDTSIPPHIAAAMRMQEAGGGRGNASASNARSRLIMTKMTLENFKSYAGAIEIGPFHHNFHIDRWAKW